MKLQGKKIGVLLESDYYEKEIFYYAFRFPEEGAELHFLTRMWGQDKLTFEGHEYKVPMDCTESFEDMTDEELATYDAIIVPSGYVSDRLRYTEDVEKLPPATKFMMRAFDNKDILKGIICHGMWIMAPSAEYIKGRNAVVHDNLLGDLKNMGGVYVNEDVVVDKDLVTGRTGNNCHQFARQIIDMLYDGEK